MKNIALVWLTILPFALFSQTKYDADALRFSQNDIAGTARGLGVAGAFGSVGADMSSIGINPAGIALYRASEFSISPAVIQAGTKSNFLDASSDASTGRFYFNNVGAVFAKMSNTESDKKMVGSAFAISLNRISNFNNSIYLKGENISNSISNSYVEEVNGFSSDDITNQNFSFETVMAYNAWLVNEINFSSTYITPIRGSIEQELIWDTKGGLDEFSLAFAGNYDNTLYFGGALAFPFLNYESDYTFSETDVNDEIPVFESMELNQLYNATGYGFNAKFGLIYRPSKWLRVGAAVQTPNYMSITEEYSSSLSSVFDTVSYDFDSPFGVYDYQLRLPWRLTGSVSFYIKKSGFISVDYEMVDYNSDKFDFGIGNEGFENDVNQLLDSRYRATSTLRIGGEYAKKIWRFRGGFAHSMSPFSKDSKFSAADFSRQYYTGGIGIKKDRVSVDFAYIRSHSKEFYAPYSLSDGSEPVSINTIDKNNMVLSVGYRF